MGMWSVVLGDRPVLSERAATVALSSRGRYGRYQCMNICDPEFFRHSKLSTVPVHLILKLKTSSINLGASGTAAQTFV